MSEGNEDPAVEAHRSPPRSSRNKASDGLERKQESLERFT